MKPIGASTLHDRRGRGFAGVPDVLDRDFDGQQLARAVDAGWHHFWQRRGRIPTPVPSEFLIGNPAELFHNFYERNE